MRSFRELSFRFRQEAANALLYFSPQNLNLQATAPLDVLPSPSAIATAQSGSDEARELTVLADEVLRGRIPLFGTLVDYGPSIAWRRDPHRGIETPQTY